MFAIRRDVSLRGLYLENCLDVEKELDVEKASRYLQAKNEVLTNINELEQRVVECHQLQESASLLENKADITKQAYDDFLANYHEPEVVVELSKRYTLTIASITSRKTITQDSKNRLLKKEEANFHKAMQEHMDSEAEKIKQQLFKAFYQADFDWRFRVIELNKLSKDIGTLRGVILEKIDQLLRYKVKALVSNRHVTFFTGTHELAASDVTKMSPDFLG